MNFSNLKNYFWTLINDFPRATPQNYIEIILKNLVLINNKNPVNSYHVTSFPCYACIWHFPFAHNHNFFLSLSFFSLTLACSQQCFSLDIQWWWWKKSFFLPWKLFFSFKNALSCCVWLYLYLKNNARLFFNSFCSLPWKLYIENRVT